MKDTKMKTLLVIHPIEQALEHIKPIISMAAAANAHLTILVIGTQMPITMARYPESIDASWGEEHLRVTKDVENRVNAVEVLVQNERLSASVTGNCVTPGQLEALATEHAIHADAAIFQNREIETGETFKFVFYGAVFGASRPVLILGENAKTLPSANRVLFAWDGEPEAAKAMHSSLSWIEQAADAHVLIVNPDGNKSGPNPGDDIAAFLARRKMKVFVDRLPSAGKTIAQTIIEHAGDINADLVVMGAYGHSRLRERLFGGTTLDVLKNAKIPVLMAH